MLKGKIIFYDPKDFQNLFEALNESLDALITKNKTERARDRFWGKRGWIWWFRKHQ